MPHFKDINIATQSNLKFTIHCNVSGHKRYSIMRNLCTTFKNHDYIFYLKMFTYLYTSVLEDVSQGWSSSLTKKMAKLKALK